MRPTRLGAALAVAATSALVLASCHAQRLGQDIVVLGDPIYFLQINEYAAIGEIPAAEGVSNIYTDINANCGPDGNDADGDWGTVDTDRTDNTDPDDDVTANTTPPDSTLVNCALAHFQDDPGDEDDPWSMVCDDYGTDNDCQDPDESENYVVNEDVTEFYLTAFDTYAEMENLLENVRDFTAGTTVDDNGPGASPGPGSPSCIAVRQDSMGPFPLDGTETSVLARICLS